MQKFKSQSNTKLSTKNDQTNFEAVTEMQSQTLDVITEFGPRPTSLPKQIPLGNIHYEFEEPTYKSTLDLEHHKINFPIDNNPCQSHNLFNQEIFFANK